MKLTFEHWFYIIGLIIINLGCFTVKLKYDEMQARKFKTVVVVPKKPRVNLTPTEAYIKRFHKVAQVEQRKFGIPASITLAQGILESGVGRSKLASKHNNHFGIKCWCKGRQRDCVPMADDAPDDRFKRYSTAWESYRHHSQFVAKMPLKMRNKANYKDWAKALKHAGYATKSTYASDLIAVIERYDLDRFDVQ